MIIFLDCGTQLQIIQQNDKYQLVEITEKGGFVNIGSPKKDFKDVVGEILTCALAEYEELTLQEMLDVIAGTMNKINDWFALHSEYLVGLGKS